MPINTEGAFESIRFTYQHEQDESFQLQVEFHHTEIGPTITIHNLLDSGPLSLPLSVYTDTVDFLRGRGAIPGGVVAKMATSSVAARPSQKLTPTRVAGAAQNYASVKTGQAVQQPQAAVEPPIYAPQHAILSAEGATDPQGISQKVQKPVAKKLVEDAVPVDLEDNTPDPTQDFDPSFSLVAGKARRAEGKGANAPRGLKPSGRARNVQQPTADEGDVSLE